MDLSKKKLKLLTSLITAFANTSIKAGQLDIDYDSKAYYHLISELYDIKEIKAVYDEDIAIYGITREITKFYKVEPIICKEENVQDIITGVVETLKKNIADHLIIIPIPNAQFKEKIAFGNYVFIPQEYTKEQKIEIVSHLVKGKLEDISWFADHTENSRSSDFWKYPLFCLKQKHQTGFIHYNSENIVKAILYAIQCFYYGNIKGTKYDKTSNLIKGPCARKLEKPSHLAVYSKENWRRRHRPLQFEINMPFDLSWFNEPKFKRGFNKF